MDDLQFGRAQEFVRRHPDVSSNPLNITFSRYPWDNLAILRLDRGRMFPESRRVYLDTSSERTRWSDLGKVIVNHCSYSGITIDFEWEKYSTDPMSLSLNVRAFFDEVAKCLHVHTLRIGNISSDAYLDHFPVSAFAFSRDWFSPTYIRLSCTRDVDNEGGLSIDAGVLLANLVAASNVHTVSLEHFRTNSIGCLERIFDACRNSAVNCLELNHVEADANTYHFLLQRCPSSRSHLVNIEMSVHPVCAPESIQQAMHLISALKQNDSVNYLLVRNHDGDEGHAGATLRRHLTACLCDAKSFKSLAYQSNHTLVHFEILNVITGEMKRVDNGSQMHQLLSVNCLCPPQQSVAFFSKMDFILNDPRYMGNFSPIASRLTSIHPSILPLLLSWEPFPSNDVGTHFASRHKLSFIYNLLRKSNKGWATKKEDVRYGPQLPAQRRTKQARHPKMLSYNSRGTVKQSLRTKLLYFDLLWFDQDGVINRVYYTMFDFEPFGLIIKHFSKSLGVKRNQIKLRYGGKHMRRQDTPKMLNMTFDATHNNRFTLHAIISGFQR